MGLDFENVAIGGVNLILVVIGLMQFAKSLGLHGKPLVIVAFVGLILFGATAGMLSEELIPAPALPWIRVVVYALAFAVYGMTAMGLYEVAKTFRPVNAAPTESFLPNDAHKPLSGR